MQLKDTEKVVLVDSGFSSTTDSFRMVGGGRFWEPMRFSQWWKSEGIYSENEVQQQFGANSRFEMGVSKNWGIPKWLLYKGKPY